MKKKVMVIKIPNRVYRTMERYDRRFELGDIQPTDLRGILSCINDIFNATMLAYYNRLSRITGVPIDELIQYEYENPYQPPLGWRVDPTCKHLLDVRKI